MAKINQKLRWIFILFNAVFAGFGCFLILSAFQASSYSSQLSTYGGPSPIWSWLFAGSVLGLSCLGIFAAYKEHLTALRAFAGFMGLGMVVMFILGFIMVSTRNKVAVAMENVSDDIVDFVMRDDSLVEDMNMLQAHGQCCGLRGPSDWTGGVPDSCACTREHSDLEMFGLGRSECGAKSPGSSGPEEIYTRPCQEVILKLLGFVFHVAMGICFGFGVLALLGLLLSLLMIHQVKRHDEVGGASMAMKPY